MGRIQITLVIALAVAFSASGGPTADAEDELKAATVLSFLRYSTWPDTPRTPDKLVIGVFGRQAFSKVLGAAVAGKAVNGRAIRLMEFRPGTDPRCCQMIYVASERKNEICELVQGLEAAHVLTVGESDRFLECGGAIALMLVDGHMSFEVNLPAVRRSGVEISSRLLRFGQIRWKQGA